MSSRPPKHLAARQRFLSEDHYAILRKLARVRVATAPQLARLCDPFLRNKNGGPSRPQTVWQRLKRMEAHGLLRSRLARPQRGAYSPLYYRLAHGGLTALGRADELHLIRRPRQHILEFLLFRNEIYATLRADGWFIGGPDYVPARDHAGYLDFFVTWAKRCYQRHLHALQARRNPPAPTDLLMLARQDFDRVERFAPTTLGFEFFFKLGPDRVPSDLYFLAVDDPRRSVKRQADAFPSDWPPYTGLLLRDHLTHYDLARRMPYRRNKRLHDWELELRKHSPPADMGMGQRLFDEGIASAIYPDLWAVRTAIPGGVLPRRRRYSGVRPAWAAPASPAEMEPFDGHR
jgi:hypothetical protein